MLYLNPSNRTQTGVSPRERFYFEGEITQFPVRVCLHRVQSKRGFLSIENSAISPLFWSQAASVGMMSQIADQKNNNITVYFTGYRENRGTAVTEHFLANTQQHEDHISHEKCVPIYHSPAGDRVRSIILGKKNNSLLTYCVYLQYMYEWIHIHTYVLLNDMNIEIILWSSSWTKLISIFLNYTVWKMQLFGWIKRKINDTVWNLKLHFLVKCNFFAKHFLFWFCFSQKWLYFLQLWPPDSIHHYYIMCCVALRGR